MGRKEAGEGRRKSATMALAAVRGINNNGHGAHKSGLKINNRC